MKKQTPISAFTSIRESAAMRSNVSPNGGRTFRGVTIIKAGLGNRRDKHFYPKEALKEAVEAGMFNKLRAYVDHPTSVDEQIQPERTIRDLAGIYDNAKFIEDKHGARVVADLHILPSHKWLANTIDDLVRLGYGDRIGISINGRGQTEPQKMRLEESGEEETVYRVKKFISLPSADLVTEAGAGGGFQHLLESARGAAGRNKESNPMKSTLAADLQQLMKDGKLSNESVEALIAKHTAELTESDDLENEDAETKDGETEDVEEADEEADVEEASDEDEDEEADDEDEDEEADDVEENETPCGCRGKKTRENAMMAAAKGSSKRAVRGAPSKGSEGSFTRNAKGRQPIGKKFGEAAAQEIERLQAENKALRKRNIRLSEALRVREQSDAVRKLLKESGIPSGLRPALAKRLMRLGSIQEVKDEIAFQKSLLESAASRAAEETFDEIEGNPSRIRESFANDDGGEIVTTFRESGVPLKKAK